MKYGIDDRRIWVKGEIKSVKDAMINVLSPTSQFGLNVFEGIPCYWNDDENVLYAFRLDDHYRRLLQSAHLLQINCKYTVDEMKQAFMDVILANEYKEDLSVRQTLFIDGLGSWGSDEPTEMFVAPIPRRNTSAEYQKMGLKCCISSWRRIDETCLSPRIKCGANYINSRYGQREAIRNGFDTCIFLNKHGKVSEGSGSCIFIVKNGTLVTPALSEGVLESITRDSVIKIANKEGIHVEERTVDRTELYSCDEAFLCGSAMEIKPIEMVDGYSIFHPETDSIVSKLYEEYIQIARGMNQSFCDWLTKVK